MKKLPLLAAVLLTGCFNNTNDLQTYVTNTKANSTHIEKMPSVKVFNHFQYSSQALRSPFDKPQEKAQQDKIQRISGCLSPNFVRRKQHLENYSLSDLVMRGTLKNKNVTWALIEAADKTLHRISVNNYIGLHHGRVTMVNLDAVKILELIPDGSGCWMERETVITLVQDKLIEEQANAVIHNK